MSTVAEPDQTPTAGETGTRVSWSVTDGLGRIDLVRPEAHNAIDRIFTEEFDAAVVALSRTPGLRVVLVSAQGRSFSVGGDLKFFVREGADLSADLDAMIGDFHRALDSLSRIPAPVVAAVQGAFAGGALGIAWACDLVIAADDLKLATGFAALGLSGDGGSSWHLPRLVGLRRAQELFFENRVLNAAEALEWGLVTRVVPRDGLEAHADATVARLAAGPTRAFATMRDLLRTSSTTTLGARYAEEHAVMRVLGASEDASEGISAFVARRRPEFDGR